MNNQTSVLSDKELNAVVGGMSVFGRSSGFGSASVGSGSELSMINLQSVVSNRATVLQLTTGLMQAVNDATKTIAGNIGH